mgnify:FL=1
MNNKRKLNLSRSGRQNIVLFILLIALMVFFTIANSRFLSLYNLMNIVRQNVPNFIIACPMMLVIASGAIDLSVGGMMGLSAVCYGYLCIWGVNPWLSILLVALLGAVLGAVNTITMEKLQIPAIMATMATWLFTSGLALTLCKAIPIDDDPVKVVAILNRIKLGDIPLAFFIVLVVVLIFLFLEKKTILGKYASAIGGNANAAHFSGINVVKMHFIFFALSGVMAALGGIWQVARMGSADPKIGTNMEFSVIASCILGGVNIKGGEGSILGVTIGTAIMAVLVNGMQMMDIQSFYQNVVTGVVLLAAVLINHLSSSGKLKRLRPSKTRAVAAE